MRRWREFLWNRMQPGILTALIVAICTLSSALVAEEKRAVAIKNSTMFDSSSGRMLDDRTILIEGDRIRAVGTRKNPVAIPKAARILDGTGKFVIPGLIDAHIHLVHLSHLMHVTGDEFLPMFLAAGVTSVRSTGDPIVAQVGVAHFARSHPDL